jgi:hypothetical protein
MSAAGWARGRILVALAFLAWLDDRGTTLGAATQAAVDDWLHGVTQQRYLLRDFPTWASARRLAGQVTVPALPRSELTGLITEDSRWQLLSRRLRDPGFSLEVRTAGALPDRELDRGRAVAQVHQEVAGCLCGPGAVGVCGDAGLAPAGAPTRGSPSRCGSRVCGSQRPWAAARDAGGSCTPTCARPAAGARRAASPGSPGTPRPNEGGGSAATAPRATAGRPARNGPGRPGGARQRSRAGAPRARRSWTPGPETAPPGNPAGSVRAGRRPK